MNASACIPETDLAQFIRGQLASDRLGEIAEHVDSCEVCQDTVVALADNDDTFVAALRDVQAESPLEREAALRQGLRRMIGSVRNENRSGSEERASSYINHIGPYLIQEQLGSGGMGTVYQAVHSKLKRTVALKLLPAARWSNATAISRFEREMEAIGGLDHPHIVRASDAGEDQGMHYLVMDFVEGLDLSRLVNRIGQLPVAEACELARQAALGLQYVHENGLVHRDVKPSNLMLAWDRGGPIQGQASLQILDLGLALLGDEHLQDAGDLTTVGQLMGTLDYMSPEQGIDSHGVDHRTDIYGLGATLFKLLTGRAPYADPRFSTLMKKMTALATKSAPSIETLRDDLPAEVVTVVDRMLARDPDQRFASAAEVAAALTPHAENADLNQLLRRGLEAAGDEDERPLVVAPTSALLRPKPQLSASERDAAAQPVGHGSRTRFWWKTLAAAGAFALAGIAYYISTDYGDIVVESADPNAEVVVKRGDETVTSLQVKQGAGKTRIRAGNYTVELAGEASGFEINPRTIDVERRETIKISVQEKTPPPVTASLQQTPNSTGDQNKTGQQYLPGNETAEALWADAQSLFDAGDYRGAVQICNTFIARNPDFGPAHLLRGKCFAAIGEPEMALKALSMAWNKLPQLTPEPAIESGKIFLELRDYKNASAEFTKAVQEDPFNVDALMGRGEAYLKLSQVPDTLNATAIMEGAVRSFERVIDIDPQNAKARAQLALARSFLEKKLPASQAETDELRLRITGPTDVRVGDSVDYQIYMTNTTNEKLSLLLRDDFDGGLSRNFESPVEWAINLEPGETRELPLNFTATTPGEQCHTLTVESSDGSKATVRACVTVAAKEGQAQPTTGAAANLSVDNTSPPTFRGQSYAGWLNGLKREREPAMLVDALYALPVLAIGDPKKEAETAKLICEMMRIHGGVHLNFDGGFGVGVNARQQLVLASLAALVRLGPDETIDVLLTELKEGNENSRAFVSLVCGPDFLAELGDKLDYARVGVDKRDIERFIKGAAERSSEFPEKWLDRASGWLVSLARQAK